ncbi:MAG: hypothetical protein ACRD9L_23245, partial [Bryobacteraceae bacterium]
MDLLNRRHVLAAAAAAALPALRAAKLHHHIGRSRISAISDEIADSPANAIAFDKQYGLQWLELRSVPGNKRANYFYMPEPELREAAKQFAAGGIRISFLNTNLLKFGLPGTEPLFKRPETGEARAQRLAREQDAFDRRMDDLAKCIRS